LTTMSPSEHNPSYYSPMDAAAANLSLRPISSLDSGESVRAVNLPADALFLIGRSADADWPIPDQSMSRRHASIVRNGETWLLTDLNSRHDTSINDRRIEAAIATPIQDGDVIEFGSWRCRCTSGSARPGVTTPFAPSPGAAASVSAIPAQQLGGVAQRGLEVLMELTAKLDELDSRESVAQAAADAVREATSCRRVVVVEPESDSELSVLASTSAEPPKVSRSLVEQATRQGLVQLTVHPGQGEQAQSIMDLGIRSAICAPVLVDGSPTAFMTIDTRDAEVVVPPDAASFCQSVARLTGLAFQRISATMMANRHRQLQADLDAARRAQELLSPPKQGRHGAVSYQFESIPGRVVAGDLFDIFPIDESRTAFFLGDVSGKGVGAAMLMAACQSQLRTRLLSGEGLADAMTLVNADLYQRSEASKFVTLVAGIVDGDGRFIELADAGHGLSVHVPGAGASARIKTGPGFPLGVVESADYEVHILRLQPSSSLVLFPSARRDAFEHIVALERPWPHRSPGTRVYSSTTTSIRTGRPSSSASARSRTPRHDPCAPAAAARSSRR
jgi:sigma-B regulation protein RsbU (phosphoserine phosphatase)